MQEAPAPDATLDVTGYALLTEAQTHWTLELATHVPDMAELYTIEKLATADAGLTYTFAAEPLGHYELRESPNGRLLVPGAEWDPASDFIPDGQRIRFPGQTTKQFANGPWARYVKASGVIDASTPPTLKPAHARVVLPYHAAGLWASRGGHRDPRPYWVLERKAAFGDAQTGEVGVVGALKQQAFLAGAAGVPSGQDDWWRHITTGEGYTRTG